MSSYLIKKLTKILHKGEDERDMNDIHFLTQNIVKNIPLLYETFQDQFHKLICKSLRIVKCKAGDVIFKEEEYADSLFMVLSGKIGALGRKEEGEDEGEQVMAYRKAHSRVRASIDVLQDKLGHQLIFKHIYKEGMAINEIEFVRNLERPQSGICLQESLLVVLTKKELDYQINSEKNHFHHHQAVIDFLSSLPLLSPADPAFIKELYFNSQQIHYTTGSLVYNVNYPAEFFYIIKSGTFKVFQEFFNQSIESTACVSVKSKKDRPNLFAKPLNVQIQTKERGDHFGMDELISSSTRKHQVLCASHAGSLIAIRKVFFLKKLWQDRLFKDTFVKHLEHQQKLENQVYFQYNVNQQFAQRELQRQIVKKITGLTKSNNYTAKFNLPLEMGMTTRELKRDHMGIKETEKVLQKSKSLMKFKKEGPVQQENNDKIQQRVQKQLEYYKSQLDKKNLINYKSTQGFVSVFPEDGAHQRTKFKKLNQHSNSSVLFPKVSPQKIIDQSKYISIQQKQQLDLQLTNSRSPAYMSQTAQNMYSYNYKQQLEQKNLNHIMDNK